MKSYAFGVDLGGTTIKFGLFTTDGELLHRWEIPTRAENRGEHLLGDISDALRGEMAHQDIPPSRVLGVGMAVPGAVTGNARVAPCVNLNRWGGEVGPALSELCGLPVAICNDANAAALGEAGRLQKEGIRNVVFITLGTGVGGGVIVNGKLVIGAHGSGGELGHIKVRDDETEPCGCGKYGCLEQYASATGVVRLARKKMADGRKTALREFDELSCKDVFSCAEAGDAAAREVVDEMTRLLGRAIAAVSCVCDPQAVILGGGVSAAGDILVDGVRRAFRGAAFPAAEETPICLAALGNDAGIWGGLQLVLTDCAV